MLPRSCVVSWCLPERSPEIRVAMRRELIVNACEYWISQGTYLYILSKMDSNNPYCIWAEFYLMNLNYHFILDTWPIWTSWRPRRSQFTSWSYLSFRPILFVAHLLVWPSYGDNTCPLVSTIIILKPPFSSFCCLASSISKSEHAYHFHLCRLWLLDIRLFGNHHGVDLTLHRCTVHPSPSSNW
jgi:hypothetical protein